MTILLLHSAMTRGGTERHLVTLIRGLVARGHAVTLAAAPGAMSADARKAGVEFLPLRDAKQASGVRRVMRYAANIRTVLRHVREMHVDVVHVHARFMHPLARIVARCAGVPLVATVHNVFDTHLHLPLRAERFIAVSAAVARMLTEAMGIDATQVRVVHDGVEDASGVGGKDVVWERHDAGFTLLAACRLEADKGVDVIIRALARLREVVPDVRLRIAGEGTERERLGELAQRLVLGDGVRFDGWVDDMEALYAAVDVVVMGSVALEGFGLTAAEAMRAGRPVVAARTGGLAEVVEDGVTGMLVPPGDADALAAALVVMHADPARATEMGRRGRDRALRMFGADGMVDGTVVVYEDALRGRG